MLVHENQALFFLVVKKDITLFARGYIAAM